MQICEKHARKMQLPLNLDSERVVMQQNTINFSPLEEYPYNSMDAFVLPALQSLSPTFMTPTMPDAALQQIETSALKVR